MADTENNVLMKYKNPTGSIVSLYPMTKKDNVGGLNEAIRDQSITTTGDGTLYVATVEGIDTLSAGVSFVMVPHVDSATAAPKLNVNSLGDKFIRRRVSSRSGTTSAGQADDWLSASKPIRVTYDGMFWIADLPKPNATDLMGTVGIQNGGTGATTAKNARINLGVEAANGTVTSENADYAEVAMWADENPNSEDRVGYFVCVDTTTNGVTIRKATIDDDVRGVTVSSPAFSGNCAEDKFNSDGALMSKYAYVAVMGIVSVIDNGTCAVNGRCMPTSDGTATPVSGNQGYQVIKRIDSTHVLIAVEPGADHHYYVENSKANRPLAYANIAVPVSLWVTGVATGSGSRTYYADVPLDGVTENMYPQVAFNPSDDEEYNFSGACAAYNGGVQIYAETIPTTDITLLSVVCWQF